MVNAETAQTLGLRPKGYIIGHGAGAGPVKFAIFPNVKFSLGTVDWTASKAYGIGLSDSGASAPEDGLVGSDFFSKYVVTIDYVNHVLLLYDPAAYTYTGNGSAMAITFAHNRPYITVAIKVQGHAPVLHSLLIDAGSEDMLDDPIIASSTGEKRMGEAGVGLGKRFAAYYGPIQWARIGKYRIDNLAGTSGGVPLIGEGLLRRFNVTFDYTRKRVYFESIASR